ncbi:hypothetical protein V6N12_028876 [Hibiscus sabdariffa]|uniref:Uncharacterized protein n=1 Tax=Hibiscus sabdariffa TaxID=183260 RepID=A0ABR2F755_9ROSI
MRVIIAPTSLLASQSLWGLKHWDVDQDGLSWVSTYFFEKPVGVVDCDVLEPRGAMSNKEFPHRDRLAAGVVD